jgi:protein SCO1/2
MAGLWRGRSLNNHNSCGTLKRERKMFRKIIKFGILFAFLAALGAAGPAKATKESYQRSIQEIAVPDVVLVNQDGERVRLKTLMESDKPLIVDFIYATCTTICPVLSAGFSSMQRKLGPDSEDVHLISITIDPENDNPQAMKEYLERYGAKPGWDFLTGSRADINKVMEAFDAYFPSKMSHKPLNFIRSPADGKWIRLFGLMGSRDFMNECRKAGVQ